MSHYHYELLQDEFIIKGNKYFIIEKNRYCEQIINHLHQRRDLMEVNSVDECDVILVFCPIVSRAGTDIDAALRKLNHACSGNVSTPVIFMVLHFTFDPDKTVADSSRFINRMNTLTVDLLFSEDEGLLKCRMNDEAMNKIIENFKQKEDCLLYSTVIVSIICTTTIVTLFLLYKYL